MNKTIFLFLSFVFVSSSVFSQINGFSFFHESAEEILITDLDHPIHKVTIYDSLLWASDYGSGSVYRSLDGGNTFNKIATLGSEYFESIQFLNENVGFISGDYGYVYKTIDGGNSWIEISPMVEARITERFRNDPTKDQKPDGAFVAYYSMHFVSESSGFVSGYKYNPLIGFRNSYQRVFYVTNDGGNTWNEYNQSEQKIILDEFKQEARSANTYFENEYFVSNEISWKTAKNDAKSDILVRTNYTTSKTDTLNLPKSPYQRVMLRSITFLSNEIGFVFGGALDDENQNSIIYATKDGGNSWQLLDSNLGHIHIAITDDTYLFLFGKRGLHKSIAKAIVIESFSSE